MYNALKLLNMKKELKVLNDELVEVIERIIKTKKGGNRNRPARKITGKLRNSKPIVEFDGKEFTFNLEVIDYYIYLDEGTKNIKKPFGYTESIINSADVRKLLEEFLLKYYRNKIEKIWQ